MPVDPRRVLLNTAHWSATASARVGPDRLPVLVTARFADGRTLTCRGTASAWTGQAVFVYFRHPDRDIVGDGYRVWMPAGDVARADPALDEDLDVLEEHPVDGPTW